MHRDIKPANIFLDQNVQRVQLMDFGLARAVDNVSLTHTGILAGTPQYMSPEQARTQVVEHRSDLSSLGSVMYAMCTGHAPLRAESTYGILRLISGKEPPPIRGINPDIPEWLCAIINKPMDKQASCRFDFAAQVAQTLEACLAHIQQPTSRPLPQNVLQLREAPASTAATIPGTKPLSWFFDVSPPNEKLLAAGLALTLCGGAAWLLFPIPREIFH